MELFLNYLTTIGTVGAVIVGMLAINSSNKNSKKQILIGKLEEVFEHINVLSRNYGTFMYLGMCVFDLRDKTNSNIPTLDDYYTLRDSKISNLEIKEIRSSLFKIEILAKCYTQGKLQEQILKYEDLMFAYCEFISFGGSIQQELKWKNGFPKDNEFYEMIQEINSLLIAEMKL